MASILVYAELSEGKVVSTSLELMTKARELGDVYAVALGSGAKAAAATLGKHGAKVVHVNEDGAFDDYIAEPATDALAALSEQQKPDLILFGFTPDSREVAGRLAARLGTGLISNANDVSAADKQTVDRQAEDREIKVWVYNSQNATPDVQRVNQLAGAAHIPITTPTTNFQIWAGIPIDFTFDVLDDTRPGASDVGFG